MILVTKLDILMEICCGAGLASAGVGVGIVFSSLVFGFPKLVFKKSQRYTLALLVLIETETVYPIFDLILGFVLGMVTCLLISPLIRIIKTWLLANKTIVENDVQVVAENDKHLTVSRNYQLSFLEINIIVNGDNNNLDYNQIIEKITPYLYESYFYNINFFLLKEKLVFDDDTNDIFQKEQCDLEFPIGKFLNQYAVYHHTDVFLRPKDDPYGFYVRGEPWRVIYIGFSEDEKEEITKWITFLPDKLDMLLQFYHESDVPNKKNVLMKDTKWYEVG